MQDDKRVWATMQSAVKNSDGSISSPHSQLKQNPNSMKSSGIPLLFSIEYDTSQKFNAYYPLLVKRCKPANRGFSTLVTLGLVLVIYIQHPFQILGEKEKSRKQI